MTVTFDVPDEFAASLLSGHNPARTALEALGVAAYRAHRLTEHELVTLLGLDRYELDGFLKEREVWLEYSLEELDREREVAERLLSPQGAKPGTPVRS